MSRNATSHVWIGRGAKLDLYHERVTYGTITGMGSSPLRVFERRCIPIARNVMRSPHAPLVAVIVLVVAYACYFSFFTILRHLTYHSFAYDLGIFMQHLWTTAYGHGVLYSSVSESSGLGWHFQPILFLLVPLYRMLPEAETLLVLQSVVLASGGIAVYFVAEHRMSRWLAAAIATAYLLLPALHGMNASDFHPVVLSVPLVILAFGFLDRGWMTWGIGASVLAMMCKENVPLVVAAVALYFLFRSIGLSTAVDVAWRKLTDPGIRHYAGLFVLAVAWGGLALFVIIPHFSGSGSYPYFARYSGGTESLPLIGNIGFLSAVRAAYIRDLFAPLLFLPLASGAGMLVALPGLAQNLLSGNPNQVSLLFQYSAVVVPGLVIGSVFALSSMQRNGVPSGCARTLAALVIVSCLLWTIVASPSPLALNRPMPGRTEHHAVVDAAIALVPGEASVHAQNDLFPHLCHRTNAYCTLSPMKIDFFNYYRWSMGTLYPRGTGSDFEYILIDDTSEQSTLRHADTDSIERLKSEYGLYAEGDGVYVYKRGYQGQSIMLN